MGAGYGFSGKISIYAREPGGNGAAAGTGI